MLKNRIEGRAVRLPLIIMTALLLATIQAGIASAQFGSIRTSKDDDSNIRVGGEIDAYVEYYSTNFNGDYNSDIRGDNAWDGAFDNGLEDNYSQTQTRLRELELHFRKTTSWGESGWRIHHEVEIEFKPRTHDRDPNRLDIEEASVTFFKNEGGVYFQMGFLEDKKNYEGGNTDETASEDAKGFDEEPSIRVGFFDGSNLDVDLRYHSIVNRNDEIEVDTNGDDADEVYRKDIHQTLIRLQAEYKVPESFDVLFSYTTVDSANKEDSRYQGSIADIEELGGDTGAYEDADLLSSQVIGLAAQIYLGNIIPILTLEQRHIEENKGDGGFDIMVIELGVKLTDLGPGDLWVATERGTLAPEEGDDVTFQQFSGEYQFKAGRSKFGPGFKSFSNDAPDKKLEGLVVYFGGEWVY